jgi:hypothetical protein
MTESVGWEKAFDTIVENAEELKDMMRENPEEFAKFRETQIAALRNRNPDVDVAAGGVDVGKKEGEGAANESAIAD